jgi:hypothetical protein
MISIPDDIFNIIVMKSCELVVSTRLQNGWLVINEHIKYITNSLELLPLSIKSHNICDLAKLIKSYGKPPESKIELILQINHNLYLLAYNY